MPQLFMVLIGCTPPGRHTEQHDVFFGIGNTVKDLVPGINLFWPEVKNRFHIDAWRAVTGVPGYKVDVVEKLSTKSIGDMKLFFINLGGYKAGEFEEFHYRLVVAAGNKTEAIKKSKQTTFFKHIGLAAAPSHLDDKYGIDVDDLHQIDEILMPHDQLHHRILLTPVVSAEGVDKLQLGYFPIRSLK